MKSRERLRELTAATWALGAAAAWVEGGVPAELEGPLRDVLAAAGVDPGEGALSLADLRVTQLSVADLFTRSRERTLAPGWAHTDPLLRAPSALPRTVVAEALPILRRALRPGGIVLTGAMGGGDDLVSATGRLRAALYGAEDQTVDDVEAMAGQAGFDVLRGPPQGALIPLILR